MSTTDIDKDILRVVEEAGKIHDEVVLGEYTREDQGEHPEYKIEKCGCLARALTEYMRGREKERIGNIKGEIDHLSMILDNTDFSFDRDLESRLETIRLGLCKMVSRLKGKGET